MKGLTRERRDTVETREMREELQQSLAEKASPVLRTANDTHVHKKPAAGRQVTIVERLEPRGEIKGLLVRVAYPTVEKVV